MNAGVGIGTLYRRFPTRDDLSKPRIETKPRACAKARPRYSPSYRRTKQCRVWMEGFVDYILNKNGMTGCAAAILASRDGLRAHSRDLLRDAIQALLDACIEDGALREAFPANDVMMALEVSLSSLSTRASGNSHRG